MAQVLPAKRQHAFENGVSSYNRASQQGREKRPRYSLREVSEASEASEASEDSSSEDEPETSEADQPVEDDYDENEDLSDREYTQHIIQRLKNSENKENRPEESGVIEEIRCVNFMCHEQLTVTLGPLINFIIGHNGSGKSAVLTALTICLGGKATATNRGQNLKSFVKEGKEFCTLSVKIKNQGLAAYKADIYGQSIIVERHFSTSGTSGFKLKDQNGKIVSTKKQAVEDILDAFALQMDNPMNILTQDMSRQFLNDSNPKKKYEFFLKGTQLETLQKDYDLITRELDEMWSKSESMQADVNQLKQNADKAAEKARRAEKLEQLRATEKLLAHQSAWAKVEEEERELETQEEEIDRVSRMIEQKTATADEESARFEQENHNYSEANQAIQDCEAEIQPVRQERDEINALFQETKKSLQGVITTEREIGLKIHSKDKSIERYQAQIDEHRQRQAEADNGQYAQKVDELEEAKGACERARQAFDGHIDQGGDLEKSLKTAQEGRQAASGKAQEKQGQVQRFKKTIEQLQRGEQRNWMDSYPKPASLANLLKAIERENGRFTKPPIGPMGRHIKLLKPEWGSILEKSSGGSLNAFVVTTKADQVLLSGLMRRTDCNYPVYIGQDSVINTTPHEPDQTLDTWMRVLTIDNNMVRNQMIVNHQIDQTVLIPSRTEAEKLMHDGGELRKNVRMCYTFADRDKTKGHSITRNPNTGSVNLGPIAAYSGFPRMQADKEQRLQAARQNLDRFEQELRQAQEEAGVAQNGHVACQNKLSEHRERKRHLKIKYQEAQDNVERLEAELSAATPDAGMIEQLEESMEEVRRERDLEAGQYQDLVVQKDKLDRDNRKNKDNLDDIDRRIADLNMLLGKKRAKAEKAKSKRDEALKKKNDALEEVKKAENNKAGWEQSKGTQMAVIEGLTEEALQICARVPVPAGKTHDILDKERRRMIQEREKLEKSLGGSERDLLDLALEAAKKHHEANTELTAVSNVTKHLEQSLDMRNRRWNTFRQRISSSAVVTFGYLLGERRFRGALRVDHKKQALDIHVQPDSAIEDDAGRQTKTLSGGEKSFSTICLLLSLWDAMGSPIRCLDEFDVFMDSANRSVTMKMIIVAARRAVGRQYIFITPQSMQDVQSVGDVKIIRMTDPERGQTALNVRRQRT